jgi:hypothetical protein
MRKRYRVLIVAALAAALVVPVGYALSIDSTAKTATYSRYAAKVPTAASVVAAPVIMHRTGDAAATSVLSPVADAAKLLFIGTVLLGLAAAVRKTV